MQYFKLFYNNLLCHLFWSVRIYISVNAFALFSLRLIQRLLHSCPPLFGHLFKGYPTQTYLYHKKFYHSATPKSSSIASSSAASLSSSVGSAAGCSADSFSSSAISSGVISQIMPFSHIFIILPPKSLQQFLLSVHNLRHKM